MITVMFTDVQCNSSCEKMCSQVSICPQGVGISGARSLSGGVSMSRDGDTHSKTWDIRSGYS